MGRYGSGQGITGVTATTAELNKLHNTAAGLAAAELSILDGVTATAAEINAVAGVTAGTAKASAAAVLGASKNLDVLCLPVGGLKIGTAGAEVATTPTAAEINKLAGVTAGTAKASSAAVLGTNKELDEFHTAALYLGAAAGTQVTASAAELNLLDDAVAGTAVASKALALGANKNVDTLAIADGGLKLGAGAGTAVTATATELNKLAGAVDHVVYSVRARCTVAEINAGKTLVAVPASKQFRLVGCKAIAYGGAVGTTTTVDVKVGAAKLVAFAQASLLQSAVLSDSTAGAAVLADGASYVAQSAGDDVTIGKTGGDADTATGVDIILSYCLE